MNDASVMDAFFYIKNMERKLIKLENKEIHNHIHKRYHVDRYKSYSL